MSGQAIGLDLSYLVAQGYDGRSAMASEQVGVCSITRRMLADYFRCCMHTRNVSGSQLTNVVAIRHCMDEIKEMAAFYKYSKRNSQLVEIIKQENNQMKIKEICWQPRGSNWLHRAKHGLRNVMKLSW